MPDAPTPEMLKRMRMDEEEEAPQNGIVDKGKSRAVTVEDVDEDAERMEEDFAPGGDADYFAEEDEEGRFYGGGLTQEQKDILNIFDRAGGEEAREDVSVLPIATVQTLMSGQIEELSLPGIRRLLKRFEAAANKNQNQRSKYPDDPTKCVELTVTRTVF